jgi:hypothetical protein
MISQFQYRPSQLFKVISSHLESLLLNFYFLNWLRLEFLAIYAHLRAACITDVNKFMDALFKACQSGAKPAAETIAAQLFAADHAGFAIVISHAAFMQAFFHEFSEGSEFLNPFLPLIR